MKKLFLFAAMFCFFFGVYAQSYEQIKNMVAIGQFKKAKEDLDKAMTNTKFTAKPEAYILKTSVYAGLAMSPEVKGTPEATQLTKEAEASFQKYREMQPDLSLVKDPIYQNGPINLYSSLFTAGYKDYEKKNWEEGYQKFKTVVDLSDILIKEKILTIPTDTNSLVLAGITAESSNHIDDAAKYYARLADIKIADREYESIYRFLVNHSYKKKDMAAF